MTTKIFYSITVYCALVLRKVKPLKVGLTIRGQIGKIGVFLENQCYDTYA
jgi:hypothetical protein